MSALDQKLFFIINREWTAPWVDRLMVTLSSLDFWIPWLVLLFVAVAFFGGFKARALLLTLAVTVAVTDGVVVGTMKKLVGRPRPSQVVDEARLPSFNKKIKPQTLAIFYPLRIKKAKVKAEAAPVRGASFPSGHTTNNFACAMVIALFYRSRGWLAYLVFPMAAAVGYSRIYTASHWPSDVFFSMLIGLALGAAVVALLSAAWRRWGPKVAPALFAKHLEWIAS